MNHKSQALSFVHPILFAIYPVLALIAHNIYENPLNQAYRSLGVSLLGMLIVLVVLWLLLRKLPIAAVLTSFFLIFFFAYGHLHGFQEMPIAWFGFNLLGHRYLLPFLVSCFLLIAWSLRKSEKTTLDANKALVIAGALLLIFPVFQIGAHYYQVLTRPQPTGIGSTTLRPTIDQTFKPDIYYIILDTYTRSDFMDEVIGFDNDQFLNDLRNRGFFVAECSLSNYSTTKFSLTSTLNMNYLDTLFSELNADIRNNSTYDLLLRSNSVRYFFESRGYTTVAFQNDYYATEWRDADYFMEVEAMLRDEEGLFSALRGETSGAGDLSLQARISNLVFGLDLNKFEWLLLQTTAARIVTDYVAGARTNAEVSSTLLEDVRQYFLVKLALEQAHEAVEIEGPKFFYLHLVAPHYPFVFAPDGAFSPVSHLDSIDEWHRGYVQQVQYINAQVLSLVDRILDHSEELPIIVIQGDHGIPWFERNLSGSYYQHNEILNAYFLPYGGQDKLYINISPVNTWRLILSENFGSNLALLSDVSYAYDLVNSPFDHEIYSEQFAGCQ